MSRYEPAKGDRVRVVLEGEVAHVGESGFIIGGKELLGSVVTNDAPHVLSVEKVAPPLPTTPGSVVKVAGRHLWMLTRNGWTNGYSTNGLGSDSEFVAPIEVIHDAGADR